MSDVARFIPWAEHIPGLAERLEVEFNGQLVRPELIISEWFRGRIADELRAFHDERVPYHLAAGMVRGRALGWRR